MQTFNKWLEEQDSELYSEADWRKLAATGVLGAASLFPNVGQAGTPTPTFSASKHGYFQTTARPGVGGENIRTQKQYKKGAIGIESLQRLKTEATRTLKSITGKQISDEAKVSEVFVEFIKTEKDPGLDNSLVKVYGLIGVEVVIDVTVEITGRGTTQELVDKLVEDITQKTLDEKGFKYKKVKNLDGKTLYGSKEITKDPIVFPSYESYLTEQTLSVGTKRVIRMTYLM